MAKRWHAVLAEKVGDSNDERVATCFAAHVDHFQDPTSDIVKVQYDRLGKGLTAIRNCVEATQADAPFGIVDLIGHGSPGQISCAKDGFLRAGSDLANAFLGWLNRGYIDAATTIRLLGCSTGYRVTQKAPPLGSEGDGAILALAIQRLTGCSVQVTTGPIDATCFGPAGFTELARLAQPVPAQWVDCTLGGVAVARSLSVPTSPASLTVVPPVDPVDARLIEAAIATGTWNAPDGTVQPFAAFVAQFLDLDLRAPLAVAKALQLRVANGLLCTPGPQIPVAIPLTVDGKPSARVLMFSVEDARLLAMRQWDEDGHERLVQLVPTQRVRD